MKYIDNLLRFNSSRYRLEEANKQFASSIPEGSLVLDAGCGDAPYQQLFAHARYESADFKQSDRAYAATITYVCDLISIPTDRDRFDFIICNQVLEHIPEPQRVVDELFRVLKPGGKILFTAPLFYQEHEKPYDFFRYTQFGWKYLLEKSGFKVEKIDPLEGFFGLCGYFFEITYYFLPKRPAQFGGKTKLIAIPLLTVAHPFIGLLAALFHRLERKAKVVVDIGAKNYAVIAMKPKKAARKGR